MKITERGFIRCRSHTGGGLNSDLPNLLAVRWACATTESRQRIKAKKNRVDFINFIFKGGMLVGDEKKERTGGQAEFKTCCGQAGCCDAPVQQQLAKNVCPPTLRILYILHHRISR